MRRLVPALIDAWRQAERDFASPTLTAEESGVLAARIHVLQEAHRLATDPNTDRETIVRFLEEHGAGDVVPDDGQAA